MWQCHTCGQRLNVYHSCRDRHCPQCQALNRSRWVSDRTAELLPVPYFHIVFTLPHELNALVAANPRKCLRLLFQSASRTLLEFAADPKYLGAEPGILMVLHTWGQKLNLHYHVHCMITCGGLDHQQSRWVSPPNPKFLFPVKALAKVFRGKYLSGLDSLWKDELVEPFGIPLKSPEDWLTFKRRLARIKRWNVYAKAPYGSPEQLLKYLAQYTNRAAISNDRILSFNGKQVCFRFKEYRKQDYRIRHLTLDADEFARRFLLHVLPPRFMRIRRYGFLANRKKKKSLQMASKILTIRGMISPLPAEVSTDHHQDLPADLDMVYYRSKDPKPRRCPFCQYETLLPVAPIPVLERKKARSLIWDTS